jgi:hypothetical protein
MISSSFNWVDLFQKLENWGLSDALLPFLLVFTLVFAILQKVEILGKEKRNFNAVVAFVMGMTVVVPHIMNRYPPGWDIVELMKSFLPGISMVLVALIMMLILIGVFGGKSEWAGAVTGWIVVGAFVIVVLVFLAAGGWWNLDWLYRWFGEDFVALAIMLLIFGIVVAYIVSEPQKERRGWKEFGDELGKLFGGGKK